MADGELLVKSDFGQVVFDISDTYVAGEPLDCQYKLTELITPAGGDWVGLFRVGWTNAKSFIARQGAPCIGADQCETGEKTCIVKFEENLPGDDGEFYQFVYVSDVGVVRGASMPFQFRDTDGGDFVALEEDDIMIVQPRAAITEGKLKVAFGETAQLRAVKEVLEEEVNDLQEKLRTAIQQVAALRHEMSSQQEASQATETELRGKLKQLEKIGETNEVAITQAKKDTEKLRTAVQQVAALRQEMLSQQDASKATEAELRATVKQLKEVGETKKEAIAQAKKDTEKLLARVQELEEKLKNSEDKNEALEACKRQLTDDVRAYEELKASMSASLEVAATEMDKQSREAETAKERASQLEKLLKQEEMANKEVAKASSELADENSRLRGELESLRQQKELESAGTAFAFSQTLAGLQECCNNYRDKLTKAENKLTKNAKLETAKADLMRETEDMRERLVMARQEYIIKYKECEKLKIKLGRLQRCGSASSLTTAGATYYNDLVLEATTDDDAFALSSWAEVSGGGSTAASAAEEEGGGRNVRVLTQENDELRGSVQMQGKEMSLIKEALEKAQQTLQQKIVRESERESEIAHLKKLQAKLFDEVKAYKKNETFLHNKITTLEEKGEKEVVEKKAAGRGTPLSKRALARAYWQTNFQDGQQSLNTPTQDSSWIQVHPNPYVQQNAAASSQSMHRNPYVQVPVSDPGTVPTAPSMSREANLVKKSKKQPPAVPEGGLPEPMIPTVLPSAIAAATSAAIRQTYREGGREEGEDEFHLAPEDPFAEVPGLPRPMPIICPDCGHDIDCSSPEAIDEHISYHQGHRCPVCNLVFPKTSERCQVFEDHVQSHFAESTLE